MMLLAAQALLGGALLLCVWRAWRGPGAEDRVLALDTLYVNAMLLVLTFGILLLVAGVLVCFFPPAPLSGKGVAARSNSLDADGAKLVLGFFGTGTALAVAVLVCTPRKETARETRSV
jgi:hypothetical protein